MCAKQGGRGMKVKMHTCTNAFLEFRTLRLGPGVGSWMEDKVKVACHSPADTFE